MIIRAKNLQYSYKKGLLVLQNISIEFSEGQFVTLVGPNGSGKTTLLKVLCGLLRTRSVVSIDETPIDTFTDRQRAKIFSFASANSSAGANISVLELLFLGIRASGDPYRWKIRYSITDLIMEQLGLSNLAFRKFGSLSSGQQQLIMIARAIAQNPKVLFLDEPLSNLDIKNQKIVLEILKNLAHDKGMLIVAILHGVSQAVKVSDWIVGLKDGHPILSGRPIECMTEVSIMELFGIRAKIRNIEGENILLY